MKNLKGILTSSVIAVFLLGSCSLDDDNFDPVEEIPFIPPTPEAFNAMQEEAFNSLKQTETFNAEDGIYFVSDQDVTLNIPANCLVLNGDAITGEVDLEFVEIFERGDMLTTNSTTVGQYQNNDMGQLISGGEFYINVYQDGEELDLSCGGMMLNVPTAITGGTNNDMAPFAGEIDEDGNLVWIEQNTEFWAQEDQSTPSYNAFVDSFGWFNCDVFASAPDPKTSIQIALPEGFDSENSSVYLAREGEPNSLAFIYGEFPIGLEAHIIFLSEHEGDFRYAIQSITIEDNQVIEFPLEDTEVASVEDLTSIINALP